MRNAMQFKAKIKTLAIQKEIAPQIVLQNYMLERFLERLASSKYRDYFIIKGGFLIAAMVGLDTRSTMDMDFTIKGKAVNLSSIRNMVSEICNIHIDDNVKLELSYIEEIRQNDEYDGFRVHISAIYTTINVPLKLDITTGDIITPKEITFKYYKMMDEGSVSVLAYNLVTILAEKLETILTRGDLNTRLRDFYDIYILSTVQEANISYDLLKIALQKTSKKRGSFNIVKNYDVIITAIQNSDIMKNRWTKYKISFNYAKNIEFDDICASIRRILTRINL